MKDFSQRFADRLRELRAGRPKTVFARSIGIPNPSTYQNYEAGRVPDTRLVQDIATRCGVSVDWLLGNDSTPPATPPPATSPAPPRLRATPATAPIWRAEGAAVREDTTCRYPSDCDLAKELADVKGSLTSMQIQLDTVVRLLGARLALPSEAKDAGKRAG